MKKQIPNAITCGNLICGCLGIQQALSGNLEWAAYFIWIAALFDFFDGFAARLLKVSSPIGKELDSLADVVSFGVLPGFIIFQLMGIRTVGLLEINAVNWLSYAAFLIPAFSAYRLAKFNLDTRQSDQFIGLPTPANGILISSFPLILMHDTFHIAPILTNTYFLSFFSLFISYILVSEIRLIALKFKNYSFESNQFRYIFLGSAAILFATMYFTAIPLIILLYILLSVIENNTGTED
jgi:CDP-diacylglycerol--serine O-phosphatidyltransferase